MANGHIGPDTDQGYEERSLLFHNDRGAKFVEMGAKAGLAGEYVLRGCAYGDIDNDGFPEILVVPNNNEPARLWRNEGGNGHRWVSFKLRGERSNRDGIGAAVKLTSGGTTQMRWVKSGQSYMSQSSQRLTFGIGNAEKVDEVEVRWPSGTVDRFSNPPLKQLLVVREGRGLAGGTRR